ncbi:MAG: ATP-binding cassette domain-containing protein [Pedosphaera sp.]|nr:ATP-binding cassette domain-containing protein [Pedosphaera sp.]
MPEEANNKNSPAIVMRGVAVSSVRDPARVVVENLEWTVGAGEFWVVAGPQRSGKSDLLFLAGGMTSPARGSYEFLGEPMPIFEDERMAHRLRIGFGFDGGQLFNRMTVAENVALPLRYHENLSRADAEARVAELLALTGLVDFARSSPASLARNWQKRAGLARALMLKPEVLLLDNPLAGLDARHAAWWLNFLEQLSAGHSFMGGRRMTLVAATDDLRPWLGNNRKFAVIDAKKFSVIGTRGELTASDNLLVRELLSGEMAAPQSDTAIVNRKS